MSSKNELKFSDSHEWVRVEENGEVTLGVSEYAQQELGDIVFVELPDVGKSVGAGDEIAVLESTKAAADIYTPVAGEIVAVNSELEERSGLINEAPQGAGWICRIRLSSEEELANLMDENKYQEFIQ